MSAETLSPPGVVMVLIDPDGHVIAEVSDFDRGGYGGFKLHEAQRIRCKARLAREVLRRLCHPIIGEAMIDYHREELIENMIRRHGYCRHEIIIGHIIGDDA